MTRLAAPPSLLLIDMQVMEVQIAVPEICEGCGDFVLSDALLVTFKAQGIFICAVGVVEFRREEKAEDTGIG